MATNPQPKKWNLNQTRTNMEPILANPEPSLDQSSKKLDPQKLYKFVNPKAGPEPIQNQTHRNPGPNKLNLTQTRTNIEPILTNPEPSLDRS